MAAERATLCLDGSAAQADGGPQSHANRIFNARLQRRLHSMRATSVHTCAHLTPPAMDMATPVPSHAHRFLSRTGRSLPRGRQKADASDVRSSCR